MNNTKENNIGKKIIFYTIKVDGANPNGDPRNDNEPRTYESGLGWMSIGCVRHKMRNYWKEIGKRVYQMVEGEYDDGSCLENKWKKVCEECGIKIDSKKMPREDALKAKSEMLKKFIDTRLFGDTASTIKLNKNHQMINTRACVQMDAPISLSEITPEASGLTHSILSKENTADGEHDNFGSGVTVVHNATYFGTISVDGNIAKKNGVTQDDIDCVIDALRNMFDYDWSTARPVGSMGIGSIIVWDYSAGGNLPSSYYLKRDTKACFDENGDLDINKINSLYDVKPLIIQ